MLKFLKDWALIVAILAGIGSYFAVDALPLNGGERAFILDAVALIQPLLIFAMLFLTFTKIDVRSLKFCRWHLWLLIIQCGLFGAIGCVLMLIPHSGLRVILEGAMLCLICPTATAAAVITGKLGGNVTDVTAYTIMINIAVAILIPLMVPLVHPQPGMEMLPAAGRILAKVFPLLLVPLIAALVLRRISPGLTDRIGRHAGVGFYLWAVALALALAVTTRSIVHSTVPVSTQLGLVGVSLACCVGQFYFGRKVGARYGARITAGQALGQKNTVLVIWMGYTFFTPVTSVVGGFYSIWHNVANSYQLYRHRHAGGSEG